MEEEWSSRWLLQGVFCYAEGKKEFGESGPFVTCPSFYRMVRLDKRNNRGVLDRWARPFQR